MPSSPWNIEATALFHKQEININPTEIKTKNTYRELGHSVNFYNNPEWSHTFCHALGVVTNRSKLLVQPRLSQTIAST